MTDATHTFRLQLRPDQRSKVRVLAALREQTMAQILSSLIDNALEREAAAAPLMATINASAAADNDH